MSMLSQTRKDDRFSKKNYGAEAKKAEFKP